ncbi:TonB-dependent siderophore receptor [Shewanella ulleungensis]|jgi:outer membrane receptor for ferric coprogen and ferric-rhodotorulic acid|uniref:TonB-dependent siderophore receptor n=1 Tax=Shewanella ulleungensis TaxID=2282699 RepID=UPI003D79C2B1
MQSQKIFALSTLVLAMGFLVQPLAHAAEQQNADNNDQNIEKIQIIGVRYKRVSQGATGLTMEIDETPQSISVVSNEQITNFAANNLNDVLRLATGINVEEWETNRTQYTSRGFEIKSTQIDGVGLPNDWGIVTGAMEAYGYEKVEVIRGANGLLTGIGNSAGTINYVRKRPTNENQGEVGVSYGSDDFKRVQADYSVLLTDSGSWAARVVAVAEDKESYLDGLENDRGYIYAVVDGQLTDNSTLALGFSYQDANTDGNTWGGLVFNYTDGTQAEWDTSATTTQEWTMWDTINTTAFVEYTYMLSNDWDLKVAYNHQGLEDQSKLFYAYGTIDKDTGLGLTGWPGRYDTDFSADMLDITTLGHYSLFGQDHEITVGVSGSQSKKYMYQYPFDYATTTAFGATPAFPYALDAIPEPEWDDKVEYSDIDVSLLRAYGSTKLNINDNLFVVAGFNAIKYTREGVNSGVDIDNDESEFSPYAGVVYSITDDINTYFSYSDIYQPQEQYDYDGYFLAPTKGVNYELGLKTLWLDNDLMATFALFSAEQNNLASYAGLNADGNYFYEGVNVESKGFEVEVTGRVTDNLNAVFGYTLLDVEDENGDKANEWAARNVVNFSMDYTLPQLPEVSVGLGGRWQSKTKNVDYNVEQDAYLVVNAFANWDVSEDLSLRANINNLTDEKYINSLATVGYYGAPVNGSVNLTYRF